MRPLLLACALALPGLAWAGDYPDLPPAALVAKALRSHPAVMAARAGVDAGEAQRDRIEAGPHEFNVRLTRMQQRESGYEGTLPHKEVEIERGFRLPGKAAKDAEVGAVVLAEANDGYGDALHEAGRLLLRGWFEWRRAAAAANEWRTQVELLRQQTGVAEKRVAAGDAARIEALLVSAQQTQAEAQLAQAESRVQQAADDLAQHFPSLPLPAQVGIEAPKSIEQPFEHWRERILTHSHELRVARAAALRQQLLAQRADADRMPDPTVGVKWISEHGGSERYFGFTLAFAMPGEARAAASRAAHAETGAAAAREAQAVAKVEAEAKRSFQQARATHAQWQRMADVAARIGENVRLLEKAWRLGEGQIGDLLAARRQLVDARLAAAQARLDAVEARYRLLLDTHELWPQEETP